MVKGVLYTTAGTRRDVVAVNAATGEYLWSHREEEGARGTNAPRQLSGRGLAYWTDGRPGSNDERILYVTQGYRLIALNAKTGVPVPGFGSNGVVDLKLNDDQVIDLETGEVGLHATPVVAGDVVIVGAAHRASGVAEGKTQRHRLRARVRRPHGQTFVDLPHDSPSRRVRARHLGKGFRRDYRQRRRVGADQRGSGPGNGVHPGGTSHRRRIWRPPAGERSVRREHGRGGSENRPAEMALPTGAPRHLGFRYPLRADADRYHHQRADGEGRRAAHQAGNPLYLRSRDRPADLALRGKARAQRRRAGRVVFAHATDAHQAAGVWCRRNSLGGRSDRFHARASGRGVEGRLEVQDRPDLYADRDEQAGRTVRDDPDYGSHELARWIVRSGIAHLVRARGHGNGIERPGSRRSGAHRVCLGGRKRGAPWRRLLPCASKACRW